MLLERLDGSFVPVSLDDIENMTRVELVNFLESRGYACYDDESTKELRDCAKSDIDGEFRASQLYN